MSNKRIKCDCESCQNACKSKPGWFKPGEAEKVADYLELPLNELFDNYLSVDWYQDNYKDYYILSPATKNNNPGSLFPYNPFGECIFFKNGKCKIHPVAPYECKEYIHDQKKIIGQKRHKEIAILWDNKEKYLTNLLGYEPYKPTPKSVFDILDFLTI